MSVERINEKVARVSLLENAGPEGREKLDAPNLAEIRGCHERSDAWFHGNVNVGALPFAKSASISFRSSFTAALMSSGTEPRPTACSRMQRYS